MMFTRMCALALCLCCVSSAIAQKEPDNPLDGGRSLGWHNYNYMNARLTKLDPAVYPGIRGWLDGYKAFGKEAKPFDTSTWPKEFDYDKIVFSSPKFWQATFEVIPGDSAWMSYYVGTLMGAGEYRRAELASIILLHCDHIKSDMRITMLQTLSLTYDMAKYCNEPVKEGVKLYDEGKFDEALAKYKSAIETNPANAMAWYETAFTLRKKEIGDVSEKDPLTLFEYKDDKLVGEMPKHFTPEIHNAYANSRKHDPLYSSAYFSDDRSTFEKMFVINNKLIPLWKEFTKGGPNGHVPDETLVEFGSLCQDLGIHELAIISRIVLSERHKKYATEDIDFIEKSLKAIAPGKPTEDAIARLRSENPNLRQLISQK